MIEIIKIKFNYFLNKYPIKKASFIIPTIYIVILLIGLLIYILQVTIKGLDREACFNIHSESVCTLIGLYISVLPSIPGYIILGSKYLIKLTFVMPLFINYLFVIGINILVYLVIGASIEKLYNIRHDSQGFIKTIIVISFVILLIFLVFLS